MFNVPVPLSGTGKKGVVEGVTGGGRDRRNLDGLPINKELWSYVVRFEFSRPKSSSTKEGRKCFI